MLSHTPLQRWCLAQGVGTPAELWRWCDRPAWLMRIAQAALPFPAVCAGVAGTAWLVASFEAPPSTVPGAEGSTADLLKKHAEAWAACWSAAAALVAGDLSVQAYLVNSTVVWFAAEERLYGFADLLSQRANDDDPAAAGLVGDATRDQRGLLCDAIRSAFDEGAVLDGLARADLRVLGDRFRQEPKVTAAMRADAGVR